jgi:hypothetical protein
VFKIDGGEKIMSERMIDIILVTSGTLLAGAVLAFLNHWLSGRRESKRKKEEEAKELRKKLIEPARRELEPGDIGGKYLTGKGEGGGRTPAESAGPSGGGGSGDFTGGLGGDFGGTSGFH